MILISILIAVAIIIGLLGLSVYMLRPETEKTRSFAAFDNTMIAHRGLFNNNSDAPENSLAAFRNALEHGFGMELDVQLTKDGKLVVFHDFDLKRMCGVHKKLTELTYAELEQYSLKNSTEKIPLFSDVLELVNGKVPLVVEIKVDFDYKATTEAAAAMLSEYKGVYCMECFNPLALVWYRKHFRMCRKLFGVKTAAWTIKSEAELQTARETFDMFIFDSFLPKEGEKVRLS